MKEVKCQICFDERIVDENVILPICRCCMEEMVIIKKEEVGDGRII